MSKKQIKKISGSISVISFAQFLKTVVYDYIHNLTSLISVFISDCDCLTPSSVCKGLTMDVLDGGASENTSGAETVGASSLYAALGLSSEDVDALAQIPESEISVETLPYLIMQLKAKRAHKTSSTTDTDYRGKSQDKLNTPERCSSDRRKSPLSSSSARRSGSHGSHEHEHHGKGEGHRKVERYTGGRKEDAGKYRKSSRESQSGDHVAAETEFGDTPTVFPHNCSLCNCKLNSIKVSRKSDVLINICECHGETK